MTDGDNEPESYRDRMTTNAVIFVFLALLLAAGIWLVNAMIDSRKIQDCVGSGRRNCAPIKTPGRETW